MKHVVIHNTSRWPTDEIMPLIRVAYAAAKPEFSPGFVRPSVCLELSRTRCRTWHYVSGYHAARIAIADPDKAHLPTSVGPVSCASMNEVIVGLFAWAFAATTRKGSVAASVCRDAVIAYRERESEIKAKIEAVISRKREKAGEVFATEVFNSIEHSKLDYKLAQIEIREKVWRRKLALATTKLKSLRRRKAALKAADTRKKRKSGAQVVSSETIPPTT